MRFSSILFSVLLYLCLAAAWPWPPDFHKLGDALVRRQDGGGSSSSSSKKPESTKSAAASTKGSSKSAAASASASASASNSAEPSASASGSAAASTAPPSKQTGNSTTAHLTAATSISPNAPPGGYSLISPAPSTTTYFKIGTNVTLAWNYTSLLSPPSAIDVLVSNGVSTYTLTQNATIVATPTITWDTNKYANQENPLQNAFYTLAVFDAAAGVTAMPSPGHLSPFGINAQFGMYSPQAYTPIADGWVCPNCNGAISRTEAQTLKFMGIMVLITLASFAWFSNGFLNGF